MKQQGKLIAVDLDDTLCYRPAEVEHLKKDKYIHCKPLVDNIQLINQLYEAGHTIVIYTARGMFTFEMDITAVYDNLYELTKSQLQEWEVKYHKLVMGKHPFDYLLDDKALSLREIDVLQKLL